MCQDMRQSALVCGQPEPSAPEHRTHLHARKSDATVHVAPASLRPCRSLFPTGLVSPGPRLPALAGLVPVPIPGLSLAPPPRARPCARSLSLYRSLARSLSLSRARSLALSRALSLYHLRVGRNDAAATYRPEHLCVCHVRVCVCAESNITATCRPQHGHQV